MAHVSLKAPDSGESPALQQQLARFNEARLTPSTPAAGGDAMLQREMEMRREEGRFLARLRSAVAALMPADRQRAWQSADDFMAWFEALRISGPGQGHGLFGWLAESAAAGEMRWFLRQEVGGEAGFEDLLACTQVKFPARAKLEMARNYWDEMGRGKPRAMHGPLLQRMAVELDLRPGLQGTVVEALMLGNAMVGFALNRSYAYHAVGALGVIEMTAPGRAALVAKGMQRLGMSPSARAYFDLHAAIDVQHSQAWNEEVIRPLVAAEPELARWIAEGALIRLLCGRRCFDRYQRQLLSGQAVA